MGLIQAVGRPGDHLVTRTESTAKETPFDKRFVKNSEGQSSDIGPLNPLIDLKTVKSPSVRLLPS